MATSWIQLRSNILLYVTVDLYAHHSGACDYAPVCVLQAPRLDLKLVLSNVVNRLIKWGESGITACSLSAQI